MKTSADGNVGEVFIYGEITPYAFEELGEHSSQSFKNALDDLGNVNQINLYTNSPGGSVFEGIAIKSMLERHKANVTAFVDGVAASIASVIVMGADKVIMPSDTLMMIHNAWSVAIGSADELRKQADDLDKISESAVKSYLNKAGDKLNEDELRKMLNDETWLSADEAVKYGLADEITEPKQIAASINKEFIEMYHNVPNQLKEQPKETMTVEEKELRQKIADEAKESSEITKTILGGIL